MTTSSDPVRMKLSSDQAQSLRQVLYECRYMKTVEGRQQVMTDLHLDYPEITMDSHADPQIAIAQIIHTCIEYGGATCFESFLRCLESYEGSGSSKMKAVRVVWQEIVAPPPVPEQLRGEKSGEEGSLVRPRGRIRGSRGDRLSGAGGELHWDRDLWVGEFLDTVLAKPGKEEIRVLAMPAPPAADPDRFVQYLEAKCNELARSTDLGAQIVPVRLELTGVLHPHEVAARILSLLASRSELCREHLRAASDQIQGAWGPREARAKLSLSSLGEELSGYLQEMAETYRPVILIHGFNEGVKEELRSWLLYTWLESYQYDLHGTVVVLAGSPNLGLEALGRPPHMVCFDPLPQLDARDLWEWAYYGHGLTWITLEFVTLCNKKSIHGSALEFYRWIEMFKTFAQAAPEEKLIELLSASLED